jgi:hypothetical protein
VENFCHLRAGWGYFEVTSGQKFWRQNICTLKISKYLHIIRIKQTKGGKRNLLVIRTRKVFFRKNKRVHKAYRDASNRIWRGLLSNFHS